MAKKDFQKIIDGITVRKMGGMYQIPENMKQGKNETDTTENITDHNSVKKEEPEVRLGRRPKISLKWILVCIAAGALLAVIQTKLL